MKKTILIIALAIIAMNKVNATTISNTIEEKGKYINFYGTTIEKATYDKIKSIVSDEDIEYMIQEEYYDIKHNDKLIGFTSFVNEKKYVITSGQKLLIEENNISVQEYVEKSESNKYNSNVRSTNSDLGNITYSTEYKRINMHVSEHDGVKTFYMYNRWLNLPVNRSFDVFAMRWTNQNNISIIAYNGTQEYKTSASNTIQTINYAQTSNNFQTFRNGISLSQNLVDNATYYMQTINVQVNCTGETTLYGTYQHAQGDVTLAQSKLFTIGSGGMGNVIYWGTNELNSIYDNTAGVELTFTC